MNFVRENRKRKKKKVIGFVRHIKIKQKKLILGIYGDLLKDEFFEI